MTSDSAPTAMQLTLDPSMPPAAGKPTCLICGGPMTRVAWGGEEKNAAGKWVASKQESWRCDLAWRDYCMEKNRLLDELEDRFADHIRWVRRG